MLNTKFEIRNPKYEAISNNQNINALNNDGFKVKSLEF